MTAQSTNASTGINPKPLKILLGSETVLLEGFISTDIDTLDLTKEENFLTYCKPDTVDVFLAEHVWEHMTFEEGLVAARNCLKFLKPGGLLRVAVPDGFHKRESYIQWVQPRKDGKGDRRHKVLYDYKSLSEVLKNAGFELDILEYWDENKEFHAKEYDDNIAHIFRSVKNDARNKRIPLHYTSLIIDARKPV